jgi:hypothetical protein
MFMDTMKEMLLSGQNQTYMEEVSRNWNLLYHLLISEDMHLPQFFV